MARQLQPSTSDVEALTLAGAPADLEALRAMLRDRFGLEYSTLALRAMATVTDEMLIPPAERGRTKGRGR